MTYRTYALARAAIFEDLRRLGWNVVTRNTRTGEPLKTPHATSVNGRFRLWFKPQAVHFTVSAAGRHELGNARTLPGMPDIRRQPADMFVDDVAIHFWREIDAGEGDGTAP